MWQNSSDLDVSNAEIAIFQIILKKNVANSRTRAGCLLKNPSWEIGAEMTSLPPPFPSEFNIFEPPAQATGLRATALSPSPATSSRSRRA